MRGVASPAYAVALLMLSLAFAGCDSWDEEVAVDPDAPSDVIVEPEPGVKVAENRGVLRGKAVNDAGQPLSGVRVSLLQTDFFTDSNEQGSFQIVNVTLGTHELFAQRNGYNPIQRTIVIHAGNITDVPLQMIPSQSVGAGYRPHIHDFWGARTEVTIMDDEVDLTTEYANSGSTYAGPYSQLYKPNNNVSNPEEPHGAAFRFKLPSGGDDPAIVFPGTAQMRVTFSWDATDITLDELGFAYTHAGIGRSGTVYMAPRASNDPWTVEVDANMTDSGHQTFTLWEFWVYSANDIQDEPTTWQPGAILGPLHVQIVLVKGEVPLEPEHEDFWAGNDMLLLRDPNRVTEHTQVSRTRSGTGYHLDLDTGQLVPPGTNRLRIEFRYDIREGVPDSVDKNWVLTWRAASQDPSTTTITDYRGAEPVEQERGLTVYEIAVASADTDAFYQKKTNWAFLPSPQGEEQEETINPLKGSQFKMGVWAYKDPAYQ